MLDFNVITKHQLYLLLTTTTSSSNNDDGSQPDIVKYFMSVILVTVGREEFPPSLL